MNILSAPAAAKVAVAIFAGAIVVGGTAAASAAVGETLYEVVSATEETPTVDDVTDPVVDEGVDDGIDDGEDGDEGDATETKGPDAMGKAAFGLCNARSHGGLPEHSTAGAALDEAGDGDVEGYCATVTKNGHDDEADDTDSDDVDSDDADTEDADTEDTGDAATHGKSGGHGNGHGNGHGHGHGKKH